MLARGVPQVLTTWVCLSVSKKENEREQLKEEELYIEDVQMLVRRKINKYFFLH